MGGGDGLHSKAIARRGILRHLPYRQSRTPEPTASQHTNWHSPWFRANKSSRTSRRNVILFHDIGILPSGGLQASAARRGRMMDSFKQAQTAGDNSSVIQAGGDV